MPHLFNSDLFDGSGAQNYHGEVMVCNGQCFKWVLHYQSKCINGTLYIFTSVLSISFCSAVQIRLVYHIQKKSKDTFCIKCTRLELLLLNGVMQK